MERVSKWIIEWFVNNTELTEHDLSIEVDYIENGWIDSFQFLELISGIEDQFVLMFTDDDFADKKVLTIAGLADIVTRRMKNNG